MLIYVFVISTGDEDELTAISDAIHSLEKAIQSRDGSQNNHTQKSDVFLTEYFEEEKEQISVTPVPSNTLRHQNDARVPDETEDTVKSDVGGHNDKSVESLRRKDTLTPLQFQSQGLQTSHYAKGGNNLAMKPPLPETVVNINETPVKSGRNRKLYNTPQLQSTQSTALDLKQQMQANLSLAEPNITNHKHNSVSNGVGLNHKTNNRFSSKFSELRVRHRHDRLPEEGQSDKVNQMPLTSESIQKMESAYRGRSSKAWKPKDKMNVAQFPWKSARQNGNMQDIDSNKVDDDTHHATSARSKHTKNKHQHDKGLNNNAENNHGKEIGAPAESDLKGTKRMPPKRVSKTPRSSQSDGTLLTKRSPVRHGLPRSHTVKATETSEGSYQSMSLQRINISHHSNNSSSGLLSYNVNKTTGVDTNEPANKRGLHKHKSGSQSLPLLHYQSKDTQYGIPSVSQTSRLQNEGNNGISDLKLPGLTGREKHISRNSVKPVINMETYQKPLPKEEGVHVPKHIPPVKKPKTSSEKNAKSDMDLLKMLLDM